MVKTMDKENTISITHRTYIEEILTLTSEILIGYASILISSPSSRLCIVDTEQDEILCL